MPITVTCAACGKTVFTHGEALPDWRCGVGRSQLYYFCPDHFTAADEAGKERERAWLRNWCRQAEMKRVYGGHA